MPRTCVSPACSSGYPTANREEEHVTFHRFPSDISLREKWIKKYLARIGNGIKIIDYVVDIFLLMTIKPRRRIPSYLTKTTTPRSTKLTSSSYRREQASLIVELND